MCRPAGLNLAGARGLRALYGGGLEKMVGILEISFARSARAFFNFFAVGVAGGSEGVASVRGDSATIAGRARVGSLGRLCMVCGPSREVVG